MLRSDKHCQLAQAVLEDCFNASGEFVPFRSGDVNNSSAPVRLELVVPSIPARAVQLLQRLVVTTRLQLHIDPYDSSNVKVVIQ